MATQKLDHIEINCSDTIKYSVIWLHGLGADGHDFEPIVNQLGFKQSKLPIRFIFPHASVKPVTINNGMEMRAWYDIKSMDFAEREHDIEGIRASNDEIVLFIEQEIQRGIAIENIILVGFSQGGVIALYTALTYGKTLGGVMALSTYLSLSKEELQNIPVENHDLPIFYGHGLQDDVIPYKYADASNQLLRSAGFTTEWHAYTVAHGLAADELVDIKDWFQKICAS